MKKFFTLITAVLLATSMWATDEAISFASPSESGSGTSYTLTWTSNTSCTIKQEKGNSSTSVNSSYKTNPRWYAGHIITFTPKTNITITKVIITATGSGNNGQTMTFDTGSGDIKNTSDVITTITGTWTSAFKIKMGTQCRVSSVSVTYSTDSSDPTISVTQNAKVITAMDFALAGVGDAAPAAQSFNITGSNLTSALSIASLTNFDYSVTSGSLTPDGNKAVSATVTVTPKSNYTAVAEDKSETLTISGGGLSENVEITLNGEVKAKYTVTWNVNGDESIKTSVIEGLNPTFPSTPESCDATSTAFVGWATEAWTGKLATLAEKTVYTSAEDMPGVDAAITYYAVFGKVLGTGDPNDFVLVEEKLDNWDGTYLFVNYNDNNRAMSSDFGTTGTFAGVAVSPSNKVINTGNSKLIWTLTKGTGDNANEYSVKNQKTGTYAGIGNDSKTCSLNESAQYLSITFDDDNNHARLIKNSRCYSYYSTGTDFRTYSASSSNGFYLYKQNDITNYMTTCAAAGQCEIPTFSVAAGTYNVAKSVELSTETEGATIYYTTDGSDPDDEDTEYTSAIAVNASMTIKAIAIKDGMTKSEIATAVYTLQPATPTVSPNGGDIEATSVEVSLATTGGAAIYYTTNGDEPTSASTLYEGAFTLTESAIVKAIAIKTGWSNSEIAEAAFNLVGTADVVLNFTDNTDWGFPTDNESTESTYTANGYSVTVGGGTYKYYTDDNSLLIGKKDAYITLPKFADKAIVRVGTLAESSGSSSVTFNIFEGETAISTEVTNCKEDHAFVISQKKKNVYYSIKVTNANNARFNTIKIWLDDVPDDPTAISNTAAEGKAVKSIVNGQLVITRDGHIYNALGVKLN